MGWTVYVLISSSRTYVGITTDLERRLDQHNGKQRGGARCTRVGRPWRLGAAFGPFASRGAALSAEYQLKRLRGRQRLAWCEVAIAQRRRRVPRRG